MASLIGSTVLGSFEIQSALGQGGFATAYLAHQLGTDRRAVVKISHPHLIEGRHSDVVRQRFETEMRAATRLNHPNLVTVYVCGKTEGGLPAIAMEFIDGPTVRQLLQEKAPLDLDILLALGLHVSAALAAIHAAGIVHRDLSPANVMRCDHCAEVALFKVLDFGVAQVEDISGHNQDAIGTPRYMAPEQARGATVPASDMFSLGAMLWWAATGRQFMERSRSSFAVLAAIAQLKAAPDPRLVCNSVSAGIAAAIRSIMNPAPDQRPLPAVFSQMWARACQEAEQPRNTAPYGKSHQPVVPVVSVKGRGVPSVDGVGGTKIQGTILIVDPDEQRTGMLTEALNGQGATWRAVTSGADALVRLRTLNDGVSACLIAIDADSDGNSVINLLSDAAFEVPCILVSSSRRAEGPRRHSPAVGHVVVPEELDIMLGLLGDVTVGLG